MAHEWGSQPLDFNQEPKKVFVNFLIWNMKGIEEAFFYPGNSLSTWKRIRMLVLTLGENDKKKLAQQVKLLEDIAEDTRLLRRGVLEKLYGEVTDYLHKTYLQEFRGAKPLRKSKGFPGVPES